jgi:hypothetical protein
VYRVFVETAGIPYANVFPSNNQGGVYKFIDRIAELMKQPLNRACRECGQALAWRGP